MHGVVCDRHIIINMLLGRVARLVCLACVLLQATAAATAATHKTPKDASVPSDQHDGTLWSRLVKAGDTHASVIVVLRSRKLVATRFRHVCTGDESANTTTTSSKAAGIPPECWRLQGACKRAWQSSVVGEPSASYS